MYYHTKKRFPTKSIIVKRRIFTEKRCMIFFYCLDILHERINVDQ